MIPNGEKMNWKGHHLVFESENDPCRVCFFADKDSCPDCDEGLWVEEKPSPWHNTKDEMPMANTNLILHILSDEDDTKGYYQSGYYEHGRWIKWNGCGMTLCCGEYVDKWAYEKEWEVRK